MLEQINSNKLNRVKKLAAKGKTGLFFATVILAIFIFIDKIWEKIKSPVIRLIIVILLAGFFIVLTSYNPVKIIAVDENALNDDYAPIIQETPLDESEYIKTEINENDDMASLEDLIEKRIEETVLPPVIDNAEVTDYSLDNNFDKSDWKLLLVNKEHPIPADYTFTLGVIKGAMKCDERILTPLTDMFAAAADDGINLIVCSPYRDLSRQEYLFDRKMKSYINSGYSYIDAYKESSAVVTVPGASEHQIGISLDIICDTYSQLNEGFGETDAGRWLVNNSFKYGFILRYPKDKEDITGIIYEPWHFRYVGVEAATVIHDNNITLEEFVSSL